MEEDKKLYTVFVRYEATIPIGTVRATNAEEAEHLGSLIPLDNLTLCKECNKTFGEGDISEDVEVEETDSWEFLSLPTTEEVVEDSNDAKTTIIEDIKSSDRKINITESTSFAGSKRSFTFNEATPLEKSNDELPDHIQPYILSKQEKEQLANEDMRDKLQERFGYCWD